MGSSTLFPRLSTLRYCARDAGSLPRGSGRIATVWLTIIEEAFSPGSDISLRLLPQHAPCLATLAVNFPPDPLPAFSRHLAETLKALRHLTTVWLASSVMINPLVWEALSSSDVLQTVNHGVPFQCGTLPTNPVQPKFPPNGFPKLKSLSLGLHHEILTGLFSTPTPPSLTRITLMFYGLKNTQNIAPCASAIASHCRQLRYLTLHSARGSINTLDHIRPLLCLRKLKCLEIILPFDFSDDDIEEITSSLPELVDLHLCPSASQKVISPPKMTMNALVSIARHCSALESLAIYVQSSDPPTNPKRDGYKSVRFTNLQTLNFTASRISADDTFAVTTFLGDICADWTSVYSEIYGEEFYPGPTPASILQHYKEAAVEWEAVNKNLTLVRERAQEEKEEEGEEEEEEEAK